MPDVAPSLVPLLLVALLFVSVAPSLDARDNRARGALAWIAIALSARYAWWRFAETLLPVTPEWSAGYAWALVYFAAEMGLLAESGVFFLLMSRTRDRTREADAHEQWVREQAAHPRTAAALPSVDVFVATYNEGWDVLEKTLVAASVLDYPNFEVYVLDDGARDWLREKCEALGVRHVVRPDRRHAKAGNINHALSVTSGDLILVLDADFVPQRNFLARAVGFFRDPSIGVVQIPHMFFNADPLQTNLGLHQRYSDDQEFFFRDQMPARDAWGVAFSCGSNSLNRRAALRQIGGIPTSSITEDILSSIVMLQNGFRTIYLNERLARGLAPEGLAAMYTQRARWARGGIQCCYLPIGPLRATGLSLLERLFFLPLSWVLTFIGIPIVTLGPLLFLWFGLVSVPQATGWQLVEYQLPMLVASLGAARFLSSVKRNPVIAVASQIFLSFRLTPAVLHSLVKPFAVGFKVTPKGALAERAYADTRAVIISFGVIVATVLGLVFNELPAFQRLAADAFVAPSAFWGGVSVLMMLVCLLMSYEFPRRRTEERFVIDEPHEASLGNGDIRRRVGVRVLDLAIGGAAVRMPGEVGGEPLAVGSSFVLHLAGVGDLPCRVVRHIRTGVAGIAFDELPEVVRWYLVAKIFAHSYENHGRHVRQASAVWGLVVRLFGLRSAGAVGARDAVPPPPHDALRPALDVPPDVAYPRLARRGLEREMERELERATARDTQRALELASRRPPLRRIAAA